jgi:predicted Rossmann-fold nucleotide-binding protein
MWCAWGSNVCIVVSHRRLIADAYFAVLQAEMAAEADAFICLPGGYGTLEVVAARLFFVASA